MSNPQHEPTMEEILASIRKIISEDSNEEEQAPEAAAEAAPEAPAETVAEPEPSAAPVADTIPEIEEEPQPVAVLEAVGASVPEDDILELTEVMAEEPEVDEVVFESLDDEPEPEMEAMPEPEPVFEPAPEPEAMPEPVAETPAEADAPPSDIFTDKTRQALDDAFASIEADEEPASAMAMAAAPVPGLDGASVEAVFDRAVRESFDPVLSTWLSDNTDAVVERMKPVIREWMDENFPAMLEEAVRNEVARVAKSRRR